MSDLELLLQRLSNHSVEFVIVGGYAAIVHGVTLVTLDVDICCRFSTENLLKLQTAVADLHPVHRLTPQRLPFELNRQNCEGLKNLYLSTDLGVVDCLGGILGVGDFDAVFLTSELVDFDFGPCRVLSLDGLIQAKEAMGRPRDVEAVNQLKAIKASHSDGN